MRVLAFRKRLIPPSMKGVSDILSGTHYTIYFFSHPVVRIKKEIDKPLIKACRFITQRAGFEPACPERGNLISSQARYGHFDIAAHVPGTIINRFSPFVNRQFDEIFSFPPCRFTWIHRPYTCSSVLPAPYRSDSHRRFPAEHSSFFR